MRYLSTLSLAFIVHVLLSIGVLMTLACTATPAHTLAPTETPAHTLAPTETPAPTPTLTPTPTYAPYPTPTPRPIYTPSPAPVVKQLIEVLAPTLQPPSTPGSNPAATAAPTKQLVDVGGVLIPQYSDAPPVSIDPEANYSAVIRTSMGNIEFELFAERSPVTTNNFVFLANQGFYDDMIFHRVIPNFMIQGGDPTGTGMHGPGYKFQDELAASLIFDEPGKLAMANSGPNTNGSQFFVTTVTTPHLTGLHTIFGRITQGQEVANAISLVATIAGNRPVTPVVILRIDITLNP